MVSWASFALEQISLRILNLLTGGSYHELGIIPRGYNRHPLTHQACLTTTYQINYPSPSPATLKMSRQVAIAGYHQPNRLLSMQTGLRRVFQQILLLLTHISAWSITQIFQQEPGVLLTGGHRLWPPRQARHATCTTHALFHFLNYNR